MQVARQAAIQDEHASGGAAGEQSSPLITHWRLAGAGSRRGGRDLGARLSAGRQDLFRRLLRQRSLQDGGEVAALLLGAGVGVEVACPQHVCAAVHSCCRCRLVAQAAEVVLQRLARAEGILATAGREVGSGEQEGPRKAGPLNVQPEVVWRWWACWLPAARAAATGDQDGDATRGTQRPDPAVQPRRVSRVGEPVRHISIT